ncbi:MAG: Holliday junction resolvase RuvX [Armatimonadota bacterium]|nr:Holliday junction resolvase RuvX [Armatimonadota bacterium]
MRLLGLDVGDVKIGVAVCDSLEIAAFPVGLVRRVGSLKRDTATMAALAVEQEAEGIVIGLPLSLNGEIGSQAQKTQGFAKALANLLPMPVVLWDESLSSVEAEELLIRRGVSRVKRRQQIDQTAAALILESYLAHRRDTNAPRDALVSASCHPI